MTLLRQSTLLFAAALLALAPIASAEVHEWDFDNAHSNVGFKIRHLMISWVRGSFTKADGKVWYDKADLSTLRMEINIDPASVDTGLAVRDKDLRGADFFDVEKFPTARFVSTKAVPQADGSVKLSGNLTLHGVTKEVTLDVEGLTMEVPSDTGPRTGATATGKIIRSEFGLTYSPLLEAGGATIADEVILEIDAELKRPG